MKDMIGREIEVGDTVAYASKPGNWPRLTIGTVVKTPENGAMIERLHCDDDVKDGMYVNREYSGYPTYEVKILPSVQKACNTWICHSERVYIIKKANER